MLTYVAVLIVGLVILACLVVLFGVRLSRAVSQVREQLSVLKSQTDLVQRGVEGIGYQRLCELLPDECEAALYRVTCDLAYFRHTEKRCTTEEERRRLRDSLRTATLCGPFRSNAGLSSELFGMRLAALRAVKAKHHAGDPKSFSRELEWTYPGDHDGLRKVLLGDVPGLEALLEGQGTAVDQLASVESEGGAS